MKKELISGICVALIVLFFAPAEYSFGAENPQFQLDMGGWLTSINSSVKSGRLGSNIDVTGDLGLDERKTVFPFSGTLNIGGPYTVFADFYSFSVSGDKVLDDSLVFNSQTFSASQNVSSKYKQDVLKAGLKYKMASRNNTDLNIVGGLLYYQMELEMSNAAVRTSETMDVPFPFIGFDVENRFSQQFALGGGVNGLVLSFQDYSTTFLNFSMYLKYFITTNFDVKLGYNYEDIDSEKDDKKFSTSTGGIYLGANLHL
jgi:hypothetical protein